MTKHVIVWDLETIPDLQALRSVHEFAGSDDELESEVLRGKFPKHVFHQIVCIGAIIAERQVNGWRIVSRGGPHTGSRSEAELIDAFVGKIDELHPTLVNFNGHAFDLPVLRYRAMIHKVRAPGLLAAPYFNRYSSSSLDLMDTLASYGQARATLHEICRAMRLPGKNSGIEGSQVHGLYRAGKLDEIAAYCIEDVTNTYRLWLRHELFCGRLSADEFDTSDAMAAGTPIVSDTSTPVAAPVLAHDGRPELTPS